MLPELIKRERSCCCCRQLSRAGPRRGLGRRQPQGRITVAVTRHSCLCLPPCLREESFAGSGCRSPPSLLGRRLLQDVLLVLLVLVVLLQGIQLLLPPLQLFVLRLQLLTLCLQLLTLRLQLSLLQAALVICADGSQRGLAC